MQSEQYQICLQDKCCDPLININGKQTHSKAHKRISQQNFIGEIKKIVEQIKRYRENVDNVFRKCKQNLNNELNEINKKYVQQFDELENVLIKVSKNPYDKANHSKNSCLFLSTRDMIVHILKQTQTSTQLLLKQAIKLRNFAFSFNLIQQITNQDKFRFSSTLKNDLIRVSHHQYIVKRQFIRRPGSTAYALVNKPLTLKNNIISFKLISQSDRYCYFGLCDKTNFTKFNFHGPLYKKGNKMYAIRQNSQQNKCAISLHNSNSQFQNVQSVPWDFRQGDTISIELIKSNKTDVLCARFTLNQALYFDMPLDEKTEQFYPFIGMQYNGDSISIVDSIRTYKTDFFD